VGLRDDHGGPCGGLGELPKLSLAEQPAPFEG